jgi:electron transfer flavoprotein beta subunit
MRLMAEEASVSVWDNKVLQLPEDSIGLKGSATQVRRIFSPQRAQGEIIGDGLNNPVEAARLLIDRLLEKDILAL